MTAVAFFRRRSRTTFAFCRGLLNRFCILSMFMTLGGLFQARTCIIVRVIPRLVSSRDSAGNLSGSPLGPLRIFFLLQPPGHIRHQRRTLCNLYYVTKAQTQSFSHTQRSCCWRTAQTCQACSGRLLALELGRHRGLGCVPDHA